MVITFLTKSIFILHDGKTKGFTTGGIKKPGGTALFGCDDRLTPENIAELGLPPVTDIFCCDCRRSNNAGILNFDGAAKHINANHCELLAQPGLWWATDTNRWHLYNVRSDDDVLPYGADNVNILLAHEKIMFGGVAITALPTPGDTEHSVSYMAEEGGVTVCFCGGLLWKGGKLPYLYRLTRAIENEGHYDYHGYLRGIPEWLDSLKAISRADIAVPYLGGIIENIKNDIRTFTENIGAYYEKYADISSINYFFGDCLKPGAETRLARSAVKPFPRYVTGIGDQCNVVRSDSGAAFIVDCGGFGAVDKLLSMLKNGEIASVDALYVTHYHDDHADGCGYFRRHFGCPIYSDESLSDILRNPGRYRLPCISPVNVDASPLADGYTWRWHEFTFTSYAFPGQTLYHGGLLVQNDDDKSAVFFAGDSFSPTGIDDYCAYNRNLLDGNGYFKCIGILRKHMPDYIVNQHIPDAFTFNKPQLDHMEANLRERVVIIEKLSPWPDIHYALDAHFITAYPYERASGDRTDMVISDYGGEIKFETVPPRRRGEKNIHGVRVYLDGAYLGQKACFVENDKPEEVMK